MRYIVRTYIFPPSNFVCCTYVSVRACTCIDIIKPPVSMIFPSNPRKKLLVLLLFVYNNYIVIAGFVTDNWHY